MPSINRTITNITSYLVWHSSTKKLALFMTVCSWAFILLTFIQLIADMIWQAKLLFAFLVFTSPYRLCVDQSHKNVMVIAHNNKPCMLMTMNDWARLVEVVLLVSLFHISWRATQLELQLQTASKYSEGYDWKQAVPTRKSCVANTIPKD